MASTPLKVLPNVPVQTYGPARQIPHPILFDLLDSESKDSLDPEQVIAELKKQKKSDYAYYPGCVDYYDEEMQFSVANYGETNHGAIADSSIKLLRAVGIEPLLLERTFMKCCGHDQLWQGKVEVFEKLRAYNERVIKGVGIKVLVTSCAEGYRTFSLDYRLDGVRVEHLSQVLSERGIQFPYGFPRRTKVTFQDPCRMARQAVHRPIYEEPRELLRRVPGVELVEMEHFKDNLMCCGVAQMMYCNEKTKGLTTVRMDEAKEAGAEYLLTSCPKCLTHFGCLDHEDKFRTREEEKYAYHVMDITQFLAERLEPTKPEVRREPPPAGKK